MSRNWERTQYDPPGDEDVLKEDVLKCGRVWGQGEEETGLARAEDR